MSQRNITYLLHKITTQMELLEDGLLQLRLGISYSQFRIMVALNEGKECQKEIADYWKISEAAVSRQIENLVKLGYVVNSQDDANKRKNKAILTDKGSLALKEAFEMLDAEYDQIYKDAEITDNMNFAESLEKLSMRMGGEFPETCEPNPKVPG